MSTPEAKVKARVRKILLDNGVYYVMPATGGYGNSGAPDFLCCYRGKFIGVECKTKKNEPTLLQQANLRAIRAHGGYAVVINEDNYDDLINLLGDIA